MTQDHDPGEPQTAGPEPPPDRSRPPPEQPDPRHAPAWPPPWPVAGAGGFVDAAQQAWNEREAIYRLVYHLEARIDGLEAEVLRDRTEATADRGALHRQMARHVRVVGVIQVRLNLIVVMMISVGLFAVAGPDGLRSIAGAVGGHGALDIDGIVTLMGALIPILYPLGRRIFLSVRPETTRKGDKGGAYDEQVG